MSAGHLYESCLKRRRAAASLSARAIRRQRFATQASITKSDALCSVPIPKRFVNQAGGHLGFECVTGAFQLAAEKAVAQYPAQSPAQGGSVRRRDGGDPE